jgi:hypothetical protein
MQTDTAKSQIFVYLTTNQINFVKMSTVPVLYTVSEYSTCKRYQYLTVFFRKDQGCGSGSGLDPDSETLWIRIRIGNPDPGARELRNFSGKNALFIYFLKKI